MNSERMVRIIAGFFIFLSLALGVKGSPLFQNVNWLWFTRFCPLETMRPKMGLKRATES